MNVLQKYDVHVRFNTVRTNEESVVCINICILCVILQDITTSENHNIKSSS